MAIGCPAPDERGVAAGERGRVALPVHPPLHSGVPPNFGGEVALGRGRSPGLESRGLSLGPGPGRGPQRSQGSWLELETGSVCWRWRQRQ